MAAGLPSPPPGCPVPQSEWARFGESGIARDWKDPPPPAPDAARPARVQRPALPAMGQPPSPVPH